MGSTKTDQGVAQDSAAPQIVGTLVAMGFWLVAAGFTLREAVGATLVVLAVAAWGYAFARPLAGSLIESRDIGFWLLGPCLGIGSLALLMLRLVTSRQVFLLLFVLLPLALAMFRGRKLFHAVSRESYSRTALIAIARNFLLFAGLSGVALSTQWSWSLPVTIVALGATWLIAKRAQPIAGIIGTAMTVIVAIRSASDRPPSWWRVADGIPFDETILETTSNGLVKWGPAISPLYRDLSGVSSVAYHHLLYLIVGLVNWAISPLAYQILLVGTPIISGISLVATLMLFVRHFLPSDVKVSEIPTAVLLGLIVCLQGLRGEGFGSPSAWFGVAVMLSSFILTLKLMENPASHRQIFLLSFAVIAVAFAKGTFVYATVVVAFGFAIFRWKQRWHVTLAVLTTTALVTAFFSSASIAVNTFSIEFWPTRKMSSGFRFDLYTLLVFFDVLIAPLLLGLMSALVILTVQKAHRSESIALVLLMIAAAGSQLVLTSTGPRSFELFYVPGIAASSLLILLLAIAVEDSEQFRLQNVIPGILFSIALVEFVPRVGSATITPVSVGAIVVVFLVVMTWMMEQRIHKQKRHTRKPISIASSSFVIVLGLITFLMWDNPRHQGFPQTYQPTRNSDWYGSDDFVAAAEYIRDRTSSEALFAYSMCDPASTSKCEFDLRPAVFSQRKFLALDPLFSQSEVRADIWMDIEISRSMGTAPASDVYTHLSANRVSYVLLKRERVSDWWISEFIKTGSEQRFRNSGYVIVALDEDA